MSFLTLESNLAFVDRLDLEPIKDVHVRSSQPTPTTIVIEHLLYSGFLDHVFLKLITHK